MTQRQEKQGKILGSGPDRRFFLKATALSGCGLLGLSAGALEASQESVTSQGQNGMLIDTSLCVGCRSCEWACKGAHNIAAGELAEYSDKSCYATARRPDEGNLTVVNECKHQDENEDSTYLKVQCMHCIKPACVSVCIVGAINKHENGSVIWDSDKCIGCRYCMVACPFQIPAFEYQKAVSPDIIKCDFCHQRRLEGKLPACAEICPMEAILYGPRDELLYVARQRIKRNPKKYVNHIYGETEVGGTSVLYLAEADFSKDLSLPELGNKPAPGVSEAIQHGIFAYFVPPVALYAILGGIMWLSKKDHLTPIKDLGE